MSYEYHLPLGSPRPGFHWSHGSWSDCSTECGGGEGSPGETDMYVGHLHVLGVTWRKPRGWGLHEGSPPF